MPPTGRGRRKVLFIGEAPGEQEDRQGVQLVGDAGKVLRKMLRRVGVDLEDCWKTNAVCCRPPKNEMQDVYIESCRPLVFKAIRELKPKVIVLMGISAVKSVIGPEWGSDIDTMGRWVGWTIPSAACGAWLCPTYHPSYVNRMNEDPPLVKITEGHLARAFELESVPLRAVSRSELESKIECVMDAAEVRRRLVALADWEGILAFDYETTGLKPDDKRHRIVSCSFCTDRNHAWACKMDEGLYPLLSRVLQSERIGKVASNLKFEERWTQAKLGHGVVNWHWDTMLAAHVLDNRANITSIKFQSYVWMGVPDYGVGMRQYLGASDLNGVNQIDRVPIRDLLVYNGMDALMEYRMMEIQKEVGLL